MALSNLTTDPGNAVTGPCTVCLALAELPADQAALLTAAMSNPRWRYTDIAEEVSSDPDVPGWVQNITHQTYRRHASGRCAARSKLR